MHFCQILTVRQLDNIDFCTMQYHCRSVSIARSWYASIDHFMFLETQIYAAFTIAKEEDKESFVILNIYLNFCEWQFWNQDNKLYSELKLKSCYLHKWSSVCSVFPISVFETHSQSFCSSIYVFNKSNVSHWHWMLLYGCAVS